MGDEAIDEPCQGCLSRSRGACQANNLTGSHVKGDLGEAVFLACLILVARVFYLYHFDPNSKAAA